MQRRPWVNRLIVFGVFAVPIAVFFGVQAFSSYTRAGNVDEVWFAQTQAGPRLVVRDRIPVGTERQAKVRHRLALVDLQTGERLARERLETPMEFLGATDAGLWFRNKVDGGDIHLRRADSLERIPTPPGAAPPPGPVVTHPALPPEHGGADAGAEEDAEPLVDAVTGQLLATEEPRTTFSVQRDPKTRRFLVQRRGADGQVLWTAPLERQRAVGAARIVGDVLVVVTAGAARDFAIGLDLKTGATRWVHHF